MKRLEEIVRKLIIERTRQIKQIGHIEKQIEQTEETRQMGHI